MEEKVRLCVWDDGTWCYEKDIANYSHKSKEYTTLRVAQDSIEEAIMAFLRA